jgi:ACS family tartrate transporter-like MFS transporter
VNSIGNLGGLIGPVVVGWSKEVEGEFGQAMLLLAAAMTLSALLTLLVRTSAKVHVGPARRRRMA